MCSLGIRTTLMDTLLRARAWEMALVASLMVLMIVSSISTKILLRSVERHLGILDAGVDALQDVRINLSMSLSSTISRPGVGSAPLMRRSS